MSSIDLSFLLGNSGGFKMPDFARDEASAMSLAALARRDRLGALEEKDMIDTREARQQYNQAIAPIIQSKFDPEVVAKTLQQYPSAAPLVQKAWDDHAKRVDEGKKTDATVFKDQTEKLLTQFSQMAGGMADAIKKDPNAVPDRMIANFYGKMADNGLGKFMPTLPFQDWSDKAAVARHLEQLGNAFYTTSQRKTDVETNRNNLVTAAGNEATRAETERAHRASEANAAGTLGLSRERFGWEKEKAKQEGALKPKAVIDLEMRVADDYRAQSKAFQETARAVNLIDTALNSADKNPGAALSAGTAFMKILDPNSVVRESELGMALNASGWFDKATNIANQLQNGKIMTTTQVSNLRAAAHDLFEQAKDTQRQIDAQYGDKVKRYGGDPSNVIIDLGQNKKRPAGPAVAGGSALKPNADGSFTYVPGAR